MRWKTRARLTGIAFLFGAVMGNSTTLTGFRTPDASVAELQAAATARRHVDIFLIHALSGEVGDAALLVAGLGWVVPVAAHGDDRMLAQLPDGRIEAVAFEDVHDWIVTGQDGRLHGAFQTRALVPLLSVKEAAALSNALSPAAVPPVRSLSLEKRDFLLAGNARSL